MRPLQLDGDGVAASLSGKLKKLGHSQGSLMLVWMSSLKPKFLSSSDPSRFRSLSPPQHTSLMECSTVMHCSGLNSLQ